MADSMPLKVSYDLEFDILEVDFREPAEAITVELAEDVFAHVVPDPFSIVGLTIHNFSKHPSRVIPLMGGELAVTPTAAAEIKMLLKVS